MNRFDILSIQSFLGQFCCLLLVFALFGDRSANADEGMYPISAIGQLNLNEKGLEIPPSAIFNPDEISLIDGICRVNGCTGSFVSPSGLIITNHHCAYRAIQTASSSENDLLENGFIAKNRNAEIPAPGYEVRITESYRDVSGEVLSAVTGEMSFVDRAKAIEKRRKEIEKQSEAANPGVRAEVAEMFTGKTYVLFHYTFIKDVRLVFAPPSSVGNFGGDVDNWEWPRHTGDFSFMRAYVSPDGKSANYAEENVPYQPKKFIQVAPQGVDDGDFVFLLGYPGRTARHKTAAFLNYEEQVRLPFIVDLYGWQIGVMDEAGLNDRSVALKHSSRSKSLANVEKRSRGQLKGLRRASIASTRAAEEAKLQSFIDADPDRKAKYGYVLRDIEKVYSDMAENAEYELTLQNFVSACRMMSFAHSICEAAHEREKSDLDRESAFMDRNFDRTVQRLLLSVNDLDIATDKIIVRGMIDRLGQIEKARELRMVSHLMERPDQIETEINAAFERSQLNDPEFVRKCLGWSLEELQQAEDPFLRLALGIYPEFERLRELDKERDGKLGQLYGQLIDVKQQFLKTNFVPDANATLRMTFGRVEGYSPEDAVFKTPITTLRGVIDKTTGVDPFITPDKIKQLYEANDFGRFAHKKLGQVPVAILYSTDTTGGNSGSPILNSRGQLVGVNFDRAFEATINDFAWNHAYSRSIGVDIRYALWITGKVYGANDLLEEMGVSN